MNFNPSSPHPERALQAWVILVSAAKNRQTLTYEGLSVLMYGKKAAGVMDKILGHIAYYCTDNGLPALTSIVVGKNRGTPGEDIPADLSEIDQLREAVYKCDWFDLHPPSPKKLAKSFLKNRKTK
jgi:hypothetical protein